MAITVADQSSIEDVGDGQYKSRFNPQPMGNRQPIAYGGCTIAVALRAVVDKVPQNLHLYSVSGYFLGPSLLDRPYDIKVQTQRQTRSFLTRQVQLSQQQNDGKDRPCMIILADFMIHESHSVLKDYWVSPSQRYSSAEKSKTNEQLRQDLLDAGRLDAAAAKQHSQSYTLLARHWDVRYCPEGVGTQTATGTAKLAPTTQDNRNLVDKTSAEWFKTRHPVNGQAEQIAALGMFCDAAMSFTPLMHSKMNIYDAGACSTLDFSLRLLVGDFDLNEFNLRETKTLAGGNARTFSECRVWDKNGRLVAVMSQQSILRPKL